MRTENYYGIRPLTDEEVKGIIKNEADSMGAETTAEFINDLIDAGGAEINDCTRVERIMWLVRHAYLSGFLKGIELYKSPFRRLSVGDTNSNESVSTLYAVL